MNVAETLRIGTRGSKLALYQAEQVREGLLTLFPQLRVELTVYKTLGDRQPNLDLIANQGKGVFCSDLEQALLASEIDLAVHSVKDLPGVLQPGLTLGAYLQREDPREVLVGRNGWDLATLPQGARVGTSSLRRLFQLRQLRPDLDFQPIRGNVETRVRKVVDGQYDATVLALAGLRRLGMEDCISQVFELAELIPAPGQGCIGVEVRSNNWSALEKLTAINHVPTALMVRAERAFLRRLGGNCRSAYGAVARWRDEEVQLTGLYNGLIRTLTNVAVNPERIGNLLAEALLALDDPSEPGRGVG